MTRRAWAASVLLVIMVLVAYAPALRAGFIWDDDRYVTANPALLDVRGLAAVWTTLDATPQYYPLTHTVFWIEHALWGLDPHGYHAVNVILHAASALLVWRILLLLEIPGAWLAAAVFAVHPVEVESVAWITELKNTLSALFYLASARVFLGWTLGQEEEAWRPVAATALYVAALLSKTVTSTLPVALCIVLWWKRGRVEKQALAWLAPMLAIGAIAASVTRQLETTQIGATGAEWALSMADRAALAGRIVWFYLGKLLWPVNLLFIYPRWGVDASSLAAWRWTVAVAALVALLWVTRARLGRGPLAAFVFFAATLAPALGFFDVYPMRYSWVADHFQYLASLGPIVLVCAWATQGAARLAARSPHARSAARLVAGAILVLLAGRTFARCRVYADEETLWRDTLARNQDAWIAHNNLGILLAQQGKSADAAAHFERVLVLRPQHTGALANLGYAQELSGRDAEAAETLKHAVAVRTGDADARIHLVRTLLRLNRPDEALPYALEAARLRPDDADALADAGSLLARAGRPAEGVPLLERAVALRPGLARAVANLELARRAATSTGLRYPPAPASPGAHKETAR